jgi:hypothetical protein
MAIAYRCRLPTQLRRAVLSVTLPLLAPGVHAQDSPVHDYGAGGRIHGRVLRAKSGVWHDAPAAGRTP